MGGEGGTSIRLVICLEQDYLRSMLYGVGYEYSVWVCIQVLDLLILPFLFSPIVSLVVSTFFPSSFPLHFVNPQHDPTFPESVLLKLERRTNVNMV